jgi:hypothetical protein
MSQRYVISIGSVVSLAVSLLYLNLREIICPPRIIRKQTPELVDLGAKILRKPNNSISDESLAQLMSLGFAREEAAEALRRSGGNIERASNMLLDG